MPRLERRGRAGLRFADRESLGLELGRRLFGKVLVDAEILRQLLYGLAMVVIMLTRPAGLWPAPRHEDRPEADVDKPAPSTGVAPV